MSENESQEWLQTNAQRHPLAPERSWSSSKLCPRTFHRKVYQVRTIKSTDRSVFTWHPHLLTEVLLQVYHQRFGNPKAHRLPELAGKSAFGCWIFIAPVGGVFSCFSNFQCKQKKLTKNWLSCATINQSAHRRQTLRKPSRTARRKNFDAENKRRNEK